LPFFRCRFATAILPFCCAVAVVAAVAGENGIAGTSFRIHRDEETTTLIGCLPTAERQK